MKKIFITFTIIVGSFLVASWNSPVEAATYYTAPNGSGTTCSSTSPCSMTTMNGRPLTPGDTVILKGGGTYTTYLVPSTSGTVSAPITYRGETQSVTIRQATVSGKSYIVLENLTFYSTTWSWIYSSAATASSTHHITVRDNIFRSEDFDGTTTVHSAWGILMHGSYYVIRDNIFYKWYGGDTIQAHGDYGIVENNDFSQNDSGHGSLLVYGSNTVIRNNYFRNRWDRALEPSAKFAEHTVNRLVENNIVFDSNWDGEYPYPLGAKDAPPPDNNLSETGTTQMAKVGGSVTVWRNNLVVATNIGKFSSNYDYKGIYEMSAYGEAYYWDDLRIYHNTQTLNPYDHGFHMGKASDVDSTLVHASDNVFKNNIIDTPAGKYAFDVNNSVIPFFTYTVENNILTQSSKIMSTVYTAQQLNDRSASDKISNNMRVTPVFVPNNATSIANNESDNTKIRLSDFTLTSTSPGKGDGIHLTTVTASGTNVSVLSVEDAYYFFDGFGIPGQTGDQILITNSTGSNLRQTRVTDINNQTSMDVNPAVTVSNGDRVYLAAYGTNPDIGIVPTTNSPVTPTLIPSSSPTPTSGEPTNTPIPAFVTNIQAVPTKCIAEPVLTNAFNISWENPVGGPAASMVQVGIATNFSDSYRKTVTSSQTSIPLPDGFITYDGSSSLNTSWQLQPNVLYYIRIWNGSTVSRYVTFKVPSCDRDLDNNGRVDGNDLMIMIRNWINVVTTQGDQNADGKVNGLDFVQLIINL